MKITIKILALVLIFLSCKTTKTVSNVSKSKIVKSEFVGTWEFVALHSKKRIKVDTIKHKFGYEIPKGPLITLRADGTYTKQFTPRNSDNGKWYYDKEENSIVYLLYYEKPYDKVAKHLIEVGHATKDKNGDYYEVLKNEVYKHSEHELILIEGGEKKRTFKRINNNSFEN